MLHCAYAPVSFLCSSAGGLVSCFHLFCPICVFFSFFLIVRIALGFTFIQWVVISCSLVFGQRAPLGVSALSSDVPPSFHFGVLSTFAWYAGLILSLSSACTLTPGIPPQDHGTSLCRI